MKKKEKIKIKFGDQSYLGCTVKNIKICISPKPY